MRMSCEYEGECKCMWGDYPDFVSSVTVVLTFLTQQ